MGKSVRSRSRLPPRNASAAAAAPVEMRTASRMHFGRGPCRDSSSLVLRLSVAFGLAMLTVLFFTLRPGHPEPEKPSKPFRRVGTPRDGGMRVYGYEIVREFYHDPRAYTQGLAFAGNGTLYESTGLYGQSSVRQVDIETGEVRRSCELKRQDFGEGLTIWKDRLLQVIWRRKKVYIYDKRTLVRQGEMPHNMQDGWGLTSSDDQIIGSDGTSRLYFMDPNTFKEVRNVIVTDGDNEVGWLNELEFVGDEIWANIWQGGCIAKISPKTGKVTGWILLHDLRNQLLALGNKLILLCREFEKAFGQQLIDVLNGIAWDPQRRKLYVTGKLWPKLYEIRLVEKKQPSNARLQTIRKSCNIGHQGFQ